jgi:thiol-disulfide isomerase/thioredoxin
MALTYSPHLNTGTPCPDFSLPTLDGKIFGRKNIPEKTPFLIMFICNHCPYVQAIEDRLITLGHDLAKEGIPVVAICSNSEKDYPADSFENLRKNYYSKKMPFVYLHDANQTVAKDFGAVCTPDFFLYDKNNNLAYRGRLDDSWKDPSKVTKRDLFNAALALNNSEHSTGQSKKPEEQIPSMGCSIKWIKP